MYKSKQNISTNNKSVLKKELDTFLRHNDYIYCWSLKRKVFLDKLPEAILWRKESVSQRLKRFFISIEILKRSQDYDISIINWCRSYEVIWFDSQDVKVRIHLREEIDEYKNKKLFFVSCF